jgi:RsiW-degrading membrane proteinase PrsW (M82 family)
MKIQAEETAERWAPPWWAVFVVGLLLWGATVGVGRATHNIILLPTIVLLGSFLVPITAVVWYLDHDPSPALSPRRIVTAFLIGGTMGVLGASLLEYWLVNVGLIGAFEVGLIEEFVKGVFIVVVALGISRFHIRDGMVLGSTVGFGFAALESSGYALAALFVVQGNQLVLSLNSVIFTELVRGILAPFGHGMWSAILGGAIFAAARRGGLRVTWGILGTFLFVSALHGVFDSMSSIWGVVIVSLIGLVPFIWLWRRGDAGGVLPRRRPV